MTRVYSSPNRMLVDTYRNILESYGIGSDAGSQLPSRVRKGPRLTGLWVLDDTKAERARSIIAQAGKRGAGTVARWICVKCGERIEGPYDQCWQCGSPRSKTNG